LTASPNEELMLQPGRSLARRIAHAVFWFGVPLLMLAILLWPEGYVVFVAYEAFSIELIPAPDTLPFPLAELAMFYPATCLGLLLVLAAGVVHRNDRAKGARLVPLPSLFLPTYLAGLETIGLYLWSLRCHGLVEAPDPIGAIADGFGLSAVVFLLTIVVGGAVGRVVGHRSRLGLPVPAVVFAIVTSSALPWLVAWRMVQPL